MSKNIKYLLFDIEGFPDREMILEMDVVKKLQEKAGYEFTIDTVLSELRKADEQTDSTAKKNTRKDELVRKDADYWPITYQLPLFISIVKIADDYSFQGTSVLSAIREEGYKDDPIRGFHLLCQDFSKGWQAYYKPVTVSFYGRVFDMPFLKFAAFRAGLFTEIVSNESAPWKTAIFEKQHIDLYDIFSNYGASTFRKGIPTLTAILGSKRKLSDGFDYRTYVENLYNEKKFTEFESMCQRRILDYYHIFLRIMRITGGLGNIALDEEAEQERLRQMKYWLENAIENKQGAVSGFCKHLEDWFYDSISENNDNIFEKD